MPSPRERNGLRRAGRFLAEEKEFTRLRDALSAKRRALPWVRIDKAYLFIGPERRSEALAISSARARN